jgi:hypothetical protein
MLVGRNGRYPVIGRAHCAYRWFPYPTNGSLADRQRAVQMAARAWSPFAEEGLYLTAGSAGFSAWSWNPTLIKDDGVPAALLQPAGADGCRLVRQPDCWEGQFWDRGELRASVWWAVLPSSDDWRRFQRGAGLPPEQQGVLPSPVDAVWLKSPRSSRSSAQSGMGGGLPASLGWLELPVVRAAGMVAAAFMIGFFLTDAWRAYRDMSAAEASLRQNEAAYRIARDDQEAILVLGERNQPLAALIARGSPLTLMAAVAAALPEDGVRLIDWFQQRGDLNASLLVSRPLDAAALVRRLEAIPEVTSVVLEGIGGSDERVMRLRLVFSP